MPARGLLIAAAVFALLLMGCGATPGQVNNSGHEPYRSGDYASALDLYRNAESLASESGVPQYNSGNALYRTEEYEDALQSYDQSLIRAKEELRSRGFFNRGNAAFQLEDYPEAVEAYRKCCA